MNAPLSLASNPVILPPTLPVGNQNVGIHDLRHCPDRVLGEPSDVAWKSISA